MFCFSTVIYIRLNSVRCVEIRYFIIVRKNFFVVPQCVQIVRLAITFSKNQENADVLTSTAHYSSNPASNKTLCICTWCTLWATYNDVFNVLLQHLFRKIVSSTKTYVEPQSRFGLCNRTWNEVKWYFFLSTKLYTNVVFSWEKIPCIVQY